MDGEIKQYTNKDNCEIKVDSSHSEEYQKLVKNKLKELLEKSDFNEALKFEKDGVYFNFTQISSRDHIIGFLNDFFERGYFFVNTNFELLNEILYKTDEFLDKRKLVKIGDSVSMLSDEKKNKSSTFKFNISGNDKVGFDSASCEFRPVYKYIQDPVTKQSKGVKIEYCVDEFISLAWKNGIKYGFQIDEIKNSLESIAMSKLSLIAKQLSKKDPIDGKEEHLINLFHKPIPTKLRDGRVDNKKLECIFVQVNKGTKLIKIIPAVPGIVGIDVKGIHIIPENAKYIDVNEIIGTGVKVITGLDNKEYIVAEDNGYVQKEGCKINVENVITNKGEIGPATGNIEINLDFLHQYGVIKKDYELICLNVEMHEGEIEGKLISKKGDIYVHTSSPVVSGTVRALNGNITIDSKVSNQAHIESIKGEVKIFGDIEFSTVIGKNIKIKRAIGCTIIGENIEIEEAIGCNIIGRNIKIDKINKPKSGNHEKSDIGLNKITLGIKKLDLEYHELETKKKMLLTIKARLNQNKEKKEEIIKNSEISSYIVNKKSIESNSGLEITSAMKTFFAETELKYQFELDNYYQLEKIIKSNEELVIKIEKEINLLQEYINRFTTSHEKILSIGNIEDNSLLDLRFGYIYDKLNFDKLSNLEDGLFFDVYKLAIDKTHKDLISFVKVDEKGKPKSYSNLDMNFNEILEHLNIVDVGGNNVFKGVTDEERKNFEEGFMKYASEKPAEFFKSRREISRLEFARLQEFSDVENIFKPIKVEIENNFTGFLKDISFKGIGIKIPIYDSNFENNSILNSNFFTPDKKLKIDFGYSDCGVINKFSLTISVKNIFIDEEAGFIRVGGEFVNFTKTDDSNIGRFIAQCRIAVIRNMKQEIIPRLFEFETK